MAYAKISKEIFMSDLSERLSGKTVLITGGTGSFGKTVVKGLLETDIKDAC